MEKAQNKAWGSLKDSFKRVYTLTIMQIKAHSKKSNKTNGRKALSFVLQTLLFIGITVALYFFLKLFTGLFATGFFTNYRTLIAYLIIMQAISIFTCTIGMMNTMFLDKDNTILLSFPCKHQEVFVSKLLVYYFKEFRRNLFAVTTFLIAFGLLQHNSFLVDYEVNKVTWMALTVLYSILLPLIPVLIGSLLSLPLSQIKRLAAQNSIFELLLQVILYGFLYFVVILIIKRLPDEIEVITKYITFLEKVKNLVYRLSDFGLYINFIVNPLISRNVGLNLLYLFLMISVGMALTILIIMPFYFKIASYSMESAKNKKHKNNVTNSKNIFFTFFKKELKISIRDLNSTLSSYSLLFIMPAAMILILSIYSRLRLDPNMSPKYVAAFGLFFIFSLVFLNNERSATVLTREGSEYVLIKTSPNKNENIVWGKAIMEIIYLTIFITLSFGLLRLLMVIFNVTYLTVPITVSGNFKVSPYLMAYLISVITNIGLVFRSVIYDIKAPYIAEYATTNSIKDNKNVLTSEINGLFLAFIFTIVIVIGGIFKVKFYPYVFIAILLFSLIYAGFNAYMLKKNIYAFFDDIEL